MERKNKSNSRNIKSKFYAACNKEEDAACDEEEEEDKHDSII